MLEPVEFSTFVHFHSGQVSYDPRKLFREAKEMAPCIIFIDELDALGNRKNSLYSTDTPSLRSLQLLLFLSSSLTFSHSVSTLTVTRSTSHGSINQLLSEMDGFEKSDGIIIIGATNHHSNIDSALIRPGRFDRKVPSHPFAHSPTHLCDPYYSHSQVKVHLPPVNVRKEMLTKFLGKYPTCASNILICLTIFLLTQSTGALPLTFKPLQAKPLA